MHQVHTDVKNFASELMFFSTCQIDPLRLVLMTWIRLNVLNTEGRLRTANGSNRRFKFRSLGHYSMDATIRTLHIILSFTMRHSAGGLLRTVQNILRACEA